MKQPNQITVLVVDDEHDLREVIVAGLSLAGFQCLAASSVDAAIKILSDNGVDVVVSDMAMPEKGGLDLIRWMHENCSDPRAILMSGVAEVEQDSVPGWVFAFLPKPFDRGVLVRAVLAAVNAGPLSDSPVDL